MTFYNDGSSYTMVGSGTVTTPKQTMTESIAQYFNSAVNPVLEEADYTVVVPNYGFVKTFAELAAY